VLTGNYDGFDQNYAIYRHKPTGLYRIIPWDYEGTWGRNCYGKNCGSNLVRVKGYNRLTEKLLSAPDNLRKYKRILTEILDHTFTEKVLMPVVWQMHSGIAPYIYRDRTRKWPFPLFVGEPHFIRNYIRERRAIVLSEISRW
jgi:spore coat protein H